jgi:hypothetical protein
MLQRTTLLKHIIHYNIKPSFFKNDGLYFISKVIAPFDTNTIFRLIVRTLNNTTFLTLILHLSHDASRKIIRLAE